MKDSKPKVDHIYVVRVTDNENLRGLEQVGWYDNEEVAIDSVKNNVCDIWETCYNYAVIEKVQQGMFPTCVKIWVFKYKILDEKHPLDGIYELIKETDDLMEINKTISCVFVG